MRLLYNLLSCYLFDVQVSIYIIHCTGANLAYLLCRCVFDSLGVVVVIDHVKVFDGGGEGNIQRCFTSSFSQHCEMSWLTALDTWTGRGGGEGLKVQHSQARIHPNMDYLKELEVN